MVHAAFKTHTTLVRLLYTLAISNLKACIVTPPDTCAAARKRRGSACFQPCEAQQAASDDGQAGGSV